MRITTYIMIFSLSLVFTPMSRASGVSEADAKAIRAAALDYIEGWFAGGWVDYMHLVRVNGEWKILNVLWERY